MLHVLPYINEGFMLASALTMALGWWQIRRKRVEAHKRLMVTSVVLASLFFIGYATKTILVGDTSFGGPEHLRVTYQTFLQLHTVLATVGAVLGLLALRFIYKRSLRKHAKIGRVAAPVWFITTISGLGVFLMLYVIYPPGPTVNVFRAWLGQ
ncbi:DUF420 domain-containing protein [Tumebacillus flagellatus]|uniref:Membrane protein n=1 Tax=Tumebacillus flagellatus TaxID=1157490 RepID=A0A074LNP6_9BACL|nr:DUF420 domain-containing protein [Tumebacillus flagellatus]KEO82719.1 membrane protein [Tumebacillus flagellatus]